MVLNLNRLIFFVVCASPVRAKSSLFSFYGSTGTIGVSRPLLEVRLSSTSMAIARNITFTLNRRMAGPAKDSLDVIPFGSAVLALDEMVDPGCLNC